MNRPEFFRMLGGALGLGALLPRVAKAEWGVDSPKFGIGVDRVIRFPMCSTCQNEGVILATPPPGVSAYITSPFGGPDLVEIPCPDCTVEILEEWHCDGPPPLRVFPFDFQKQKNRIERKMLDYYSTVSR